MTFGRSATHHPGTIHLGRAQTGAARGGEGPGGLAGEAEREAGLQGGDVLGREIPHDEHKAVGGRAGEAAGGVESAADGLEEQTFRHVGRRKDAFEAEETFTRKAREVFEPFEDGVDGCALDMGGEHGDAGVAGRLVGDGAGGGVGGESEEGAAGGVRFNERGGERVDAGEACGEA